MVATLDVLDRVIDVLTAFPKPEEVLKLHTTHEEHSRIQFLVDRSKANNITTSEQTELDRYFIAEKCVRLAKARALKAIHDSRDE